MTLLDLLCSLRQRLLNAIDQNDKVLLSELKSTFTLLEEAFYESKNRTLIGIVVDMGDAARNGAELRWKSNIPSIEEIKNALSE